MAEEAGRFCDAYCLARLRHHSREVSADRRRGNGVFVASQSLRMKSDD